MANETIPAERWLGTTLLVNATLANRVYKHPAPPEAQEPFVTYLFQSGTDLMVVGAIRVWANMVYLVRATDKTNSVLTLKPYADALDAALHAGSGTVVDGVVWSCVREAPHSATTIERGVRYEHIGGFYRLQVSAVEA